MVPLSTRRTRQRESQTICTFSERVLAPWPLLLGGLGVRRCDRVSQGGLCNRESLCLNPIPSFNGYLTFEPNISEPIFSPIKLGQYQLQGAILIMKWDNIAQCLWLSICLIDVCEVNEQGLNKVPLLDEAMFSLKAQHCSVFSITSMSFPKPPRQASHSFSDSQSGVNLQSRSPGRRDLANPFPKPVSSPAGTETLHICSFHGNYENLLPLIVFLFLTMERSHDFNRKNNSGTGTAWIEPWTFWALGEKRHLMLAGQEAWPAYTQTRLAT